MLIKLIDVWENVVEHYYAEIRPNHQNVSIWDWIKYEYHGNRMGYMPQQGIYEYFEFDNDIDATAFKLKFLVTDDI